MTTAPSLRRTPSAPAVVGYVRTAAGQNPVPQINMLMQAGVAEESIYIENTNGHKTTWPERDLLLPRLRSGDTITVTRLDRLFYSVQNLIIVGTDLRNRGIRLQAVEQNIDSNTLEGRDFFGMMSVFASLHHEFVRAATNDGLAAARARGKTSGRPPRLTPEQAEQAQQLYDSGTPVPKIAQTFKIGRSTIYGYITLKAAK
ncbi:recombinase family protein [Streptomyces sp. NBC_01314]|uniref:recombinase family protein n=1 Tax=Streptomyces sp. NBC_01314 TaxID=2903821 RepID=UPI00308C3D6B|nr:recombinase family protein [Streptomyces sp. NBC_01314]